MATPQRDNAWDRGTHFRSISVAVSALQATEVEHLYDGPNGLGYLPDTQSQTRFDSVAGGILTPTPDHYMSVTFLPYRSPSACGEVAERLQWETFSGW